MRSPSGYTNRLALLRRYRETFAQAWRARHRDSTLLLTADEAAFSPPALSLEQRPVSPTARVTAALLVGLVMVALAWAALGRVDIVANATGEVIPSTRTQAIASVDTAVVRAIHVREGQAVEAGEVLLELDATPFRAAFEKATSQVQTAQLQVARSRALILAITSNHPPRLAPVPRVSAERLRQAQLHLDGQYREFATRLAQLDSDIDRYARALPVALEREKIYAGLLKTHDVSRDAWLEKQQDRIDLEGQLADARDARAAWIAQAEREAFDALAGAAQTAVSARQDAIGAASHAGWLTLRSPVSGTVQQLTVHTVGGVVQAAQPLMLIVPADVHMQVEAFLQNRDVGFVKQGQSAQVKVAAFDYTRYGAIPGRVMSVSRDAIESNDARQDAGDLRQRNDDIQGQDGGSRYLVRVALDKSTMFVDGHVQRLVPGMSVSVEIKTGRRRIIEYVLSPILRTGSGSFHER